MPSSIATSFSKYSAASWLFCALAIVCNLTTAVLEILLAVVLASKQDKVTVITCVALAFEGISLVVFLWLSGSELLRRPGNDSRTGGRTHVKHGHLLFSVALSAVAAAITIGAGIWMAIGVEHIAQEMHQSPWGFIAALLATTILSTIFQLAFFVLLRRSKPVAETVEESRSMPEIVQVVRPATSKSTIVSNPFSSHAEVSSPPMSPSSASLRSSITLPSRTGSSRTRLTVSRPSSKSAEVAQIDFTWDTSSVPSSLRDAVYSHSKMGTTPLPPIPGSRPVSPAKALDGPFLPPSPHPPQSQPSSPLDAAFPRPSSPTAAQAVDVVPLAPPQAPFMMFSTPTRSRTGSLNSRSDSPDLLQMQMQLKRAASATSLAESVSHLKTQPSFDEENIHPLFRATSPTPPPSASRNTIVTAATVSEAEEIASIRPRRKTESRVGSPLAQSPSIDSPSLDSPEFFTPNSQRGGFEWPLQASPVSPIEDESSPGEDRVVGTPTPGQAAPASETQASSESRDSDEDPKESFDSTAIPNFILAAGSRGSMQNFETRKRKSEYSADEE